MNKEIFIPVGATFKLRGKEYRVMRDFKTGICRHECSFFSPFGSNSVEDKIKDKICAKLTCKTGLRPDRYKVFFQEVKQ